MEELIDTYWDANEHDKIVELIMTIPEAERDIDMLGQLVVAYNNLCQYDDAINLSLDLKAQSIEIPAWYYRIGYAYFRKRNYAQAADYFETGITLANKIGNISSAKNNQELYEECLPHLRDKKKEKKIEEILSMNTINLSEYKKSIFVHGLTEEELLKKINMYEKIASSGNKKAEIILKYCAIDKNWFCIDYIYAKDFENWNFWHYQNLLLWLVDEKNNFCFAYKDFNTYSDTFYSYANIHDKSGASVIGLFKNARFYYEVPGFYLKWMSDENTCNLNSDILYLQRHIDMGLLTDMENCEWKKIKITVSD